MTGVRDETLVGRTLNGRYKIGERIARGGMASVFKAEDMRLDRTVAVKVMHQNLGDEDAFLKRFNREAKAAAKLNHRGVVSVFDQGTDGDVTYLVMEYVPGSTLRDVMRMENPMSPEHSLEFLAGVLVALSAAHAAGIIHRDIKPENVLITPDGDVKVADFGLARAISANTQGNGDGTVMGTVSYLAPEIVSNQGADARSDVYACGAMLYEMLTGSKPHSGDTPIQVAYRHVHEDIGRPSSVVPELPDYVDALVARATDRDPYRRPADARGLLQLVKLVQRAIEQHLPSDPDLVRQLLPPLVPLDDIATVPVPTTGNSVGRHTNHEASVPPRKPGKYSAGAASEAIAEATANIDAILKGASNPDRHDTEPFSLESFNAGKYGAEMFGNGRTEPPSERTVQWSTGDPAPRGMVPAMSRDQYRADRESSDGDNRGKGLLITTVIAALVVGAIGWYLGFGRFDDTPMLVGMSESEAVIEAKNGGYVFRVTERAFSETAPLGTVITTDPKPGGNILPGEAIDAIISKGMERYPVPELRNLRIADAIRKLNEVHLKPGLVTEGWSETVTEGKVRGTKGYTAGDHVRRGTKIDLVVSKGREPIQIRSFIGSSRDAAIGGLRGLGFGVSVVNGYSDTAPVGRVIAQVPSGGTGHRNDVIRITVSLGPDTVKVPSVIGLKADSAAGRIRGAGLTAGGEGGNGRVVSQSPGAGTSVRRGSTVSYTVASEPVQQGSDCSKKRQRRGLC